MDQDISKIIHFVFPCVYNLKQQQQQNSHIDHFICRPNNNKKPSWEEEKTSLFTLPSTFHLFFSFF